MQDILHGHFHRLIASKNNSAGSGNSSDRGTFLENAIESLQTLSHDVKRTLDLLQDMDGTSSQSMKQLQALYQQYITAAEERMMELEIVVEEAERHSEQEDSSDRPEAPFVSHTLPVTAGVRVLGGGPDDAVIIPSTTELMDYVYSSQNNHNNNNEQDGDKDMNEDGDESGSDSKDDLAARPLDPSATFSQIVALQKECLQKADEKVAIAEQAYAIVDSTVQRLDHDLRSMEQFLLQSAGDFTNTRAGVGTAAAVPQLADTVGKPNDLVACQVTPGSEWILAKILQYDPTTGMYNLADEDVESKKLFHLPESQVVLCGVDNLRKGETIFAVYPDTTSFYQATVVQAPRKTAATSGAFVMVNFVDDSDEYGVTHDKAVPLKHVIYPPYGATVI